MILDLIRNQANPTFRFIVSIAGISQGVFTECTLPTIEWETEEVKEGGLNTYIHQLPGRRRGTKLVLKNGVGSSHLMHWYRESMNELLHRRNITIVLLNSKHKLTVPMMIWNIQDAYPTKWAGPQLNTSQNSIAIQTLEFACGHVTMEM